MPMRKNVVVLAVAVVLAAANLLWAADPASTTITIPDLHCKGCAKQVEAKLAKVQGVAKTKADLTAKTIRVTPKDRAVLSAKALWEAVEEAGKEPTKVEGPGGVHTSKPQS
jgi:copper chaperone CopZ